MRVVNPADLDQLARLLDGRRGLSGQLDEAFTRASRLGVGHQLAAVRPMHAWTSDNAPDIRRRAAFARLESGDPTAGLQWAGFTTKELAEAAAGLLSPEPLIIAYAMATSGDPKAESFRRRPNESAHDWADRVRAHAIAQIPMLTPHGDQIRNLISMYGDVKGIVDFGSHAVFHGTNVTRILVGNSLARGWGMTLKSWTADQIVARIPLAQADTWATGLRDAQPVIGSLSAPGSWLPSRLSRLASGSSLFQNANRVPFIRNHVSGRLGSIWDEVLRSSIANNAIRGWTVNRLITTLVGNDTLARIYGGFTHSGQAVMRAGQASLYQVTKNTYVAARAAEVGHGGSLLEGLGNAFKVSGGLRTFGIAGGVASTAYSGYNLYAQGSPLKKFHSGKESAGYAADVAEFGFNASLTAATVCPNPFTIGAVAAFGTAYVGVKAVERWGDIKKEADKVVAWSATQADRATRGVKELAHEANPMNWLQTVADNMQKTGRAPTS
ncbi:PE-PGRS family protein [Streptomyces sp. NPDC002265]|uniref:PE-PGRS family protein n=1 Tax=Streptomyces sp. NPDC002265 TaxID=3154415 RepID=UPI003326BCB8